MKKLDKKDLEKLVGQLASGLKNQIPEGTGFTLLLFDFGAKGNVAYVSTGQRVQTVELLKEMIQKLEAS